MNVMVALKQLADARLNPFDEIALEAALRLRDTPAAFGLEAVQAVSVVSIGPNVWEEGLRTALAMGADRGIRVEAEAGLEPLSVARCLAAVVTQEGGHLLLTGRQSVDGDHNQTGQMAAALLGWGQATCAAELTFATAPTGNGREAIVVREVDHGLERWAVSLPAVITVDVRLNGIHETGGPRYASLPNIMRARRKPLHLYSPASLGVDLIPTVRTMARHPPHPRPPGKRLHTMEALVEELRMAQLI